MAIAFRSVNSVAYASHSSTVIPAPSGIANDDILIAIVAVGGSGGNPGSSTPPAGFTAVTTPTFVQGGSFYVNLGVYWKRAASESGSYTFTHSTLSTEGVMLAYSGCLASGSPIDSGITTQDGPGGTSTLASITTTVANAMLLAVGQNWDANGSTPPSGMTERFDHLITVDDVIQASAGASGSKVISPNGTTSGNWQGWLFALKPATAGGGVSADAGSQTITASVGAATVQAKANVSPTTNTATVSVGQATVAAKASVSPTTNLLTASIDQVTVQAKANVSPTTNLLSTAVGQVTVDTGSAGVDVNVASQTLTASVDAVVASGAANVTTTTNLLTASVGAATVQARASVTVEGQVVTASVDQATVAGKANVSPTTNLLTTSVSGVTATAGATASVTTNLLTASVGQVTVNAIASVQVNVTGNLLSMSVGQVVVEDDSGIVIPVYARRKQMLSNPPRMMGN